MPEKSAGYAAPRAIALLWHGRGPNEGHVLDTLAAALRRQSCSVLAPDWDSSAADDGEGALRASLAEAFRLAGGEGDVPVVVVGWSLGGTAALSLALDASSEPSAAQGLAAAVRAVDAALAGQRNA